MVDAGFFEIDCELNWPVILEFCDLQLYCLIPCAPSLQRRIPSIYSYQLIVRSWWFWRIELSLKA